MLCQLGLTSRPVGSCSVSAEKKGSDSTGTRRSGTPAGRPSARRAWAISAGVGDSTLADLLLDRTKNPITTFHVLNFVAAWGIYVDHYGHEPDSLRDVAAGIGVTYQTLYRWQGKFRKAFPEYNTPAVLWESVRDEITATTPESAAWQLGAVKLA